MNDRGSPGRAVGYEERDLKPRIIALALLIVAGLVFLSVLGSRGVMKGLGNRTGEPHPGSRPFEAADRGRALSEPLLQLDPGADRARMDAVEDSLLDSYGWVSPDSGLVRVPIAEAMKLVLEDGLPARSGADTVPAPPVRTESGVRTPKGGHR